MKASDLMTEEWAAILPKADQLLEVIQTHLRIEKENNINVFPNPEDIFRVFYEMQFADIKVVIIGDEPFSNDNRQNTGRAFECQTHPREPWRSFAKAYSQQVEHPRPGIVAGHLDNWALQGVFLLNRALTVREGLPQSHVAIWKPFIEHVISTLLTDLNGRAFVIIGNEAKKLIPHVSSPHKGFYYEDIQTALEERRHWHAPALFKDVNKFVKFQFGTPINW